MIKQALQENASRWVKPYITDLVGEDILKIKWTSEEVTFMCKSGVYVFKAEGDCCSTSWIEAFDDSKDLTGVILAVKTLELPQIQTEEPDSLKVYGYGIITQVGEYTLEFRNESNGYYGGWLELTSIDGKPVFEARESLKRNINEE